jgi:hypothetical protein
MRYTYKDFAIDATPDFSLGRFFARARITCNRCGGENDGETHDLRDLGHFEAERDAVVFARVWAVSWIDEHERQLTAPNA